MTISYYLIGIVSFLLSYFITEFLSGKKEGVPGKIGSLIFKIGNYTVHIHHWFLGTILLIILIKIKYYNIIILGSLFGIILQGLSYNDFYKIIYKTNKL